MSIRDCIPQNQDCLGYALPLKRIRHSTQILYLSAIAHRIATQYGVAATKIATEIVQVINQQKANCWQQTEQTEPLATLWQGITVQVTAADDLLFQVHDRAIAVWLNSLVHDSLTFPASLASPPSPTPFLPNPFPLQQAHARCCSLLRLADHTELIKLQLPNDNSATWQWLQPEPIPWLTPTEQLYPSQAAERHLIKHICTMLDQWAERSPTPKLLGQQAEQLTQTFQAAHRAYPIWGDRHPGANERQQAHLGLLLVTQRVLRQLLNTLGIPAPAEL